MKNTFIIQCYKQGQLLMNKEIELTAEQVDFFKIISNGDKKFKLLNEDVEELNGQVDRGLEYFLEIR